MKRIGLCNKMSVDHYFAPRSVGIPLDCMQDLDDDVQEGQIPSLITKQIQKTNYTIRRGDTVSLIPANEKYRNDFTYIWNGEKAIDLDFTIDPQGSVPPEFVVTKTDFAPDWWVNTIDHNGIFHADPEQVFARGEHGRDDMTDDMYHYPCDFAEVTWSCQIHEDIREKGNLQFDLNAEQQEEQQQYEGPKFFAKSRGYTPKEY